MKTKITIATLLFGLTVNAQLSNFEGFWFSNDTSYNVLSSLSLGITIHFS